MGLTGNLETNSIGGFGAGFGGFGGIAPVGLIGLNTLFDRDRKDCGNDGGGRGMIGENALLAAIANSKDTTVAEGRNLANAVCDAEKTNLTQFYAAAIQAANNTQDIKDQAQAFQIANTAEFQALAAAGVNQTAAILARINQVETDGLRDRLAERTREVDAKVIEINNINTNTNVLTAIQSIKNDTDRRFDALFGSFNQLNRNTQDVINFGTMAASANQANQQTNVK